MTFRDICYQDFPAAISTEMHSQQSTELALGTLLVCFYDFLQCWIPESIGFGRMFGTLLDWYLVCIVTLDLTLMIQTLFLLSIIILG